MYSVVTAGKFLDHHDGQGNVNAHHSKRRHGNIITALRYWVCGQLLLPKYTMIFFKMPSNKGPMSVLLVLTSDLVTVLELE